MGDPEVGNGRTPYRVTEVLKGKVPAATIYDFLRGTSPLNSL